MYGVWIRDTYVHTLHITNYNIRSVYNTYRDNICRTICMYVHNVVIGYIWNALLSLPPEYISERKSLNMSRLTCFPPPLSYFKKASHPEFDELQFPPIGTIHTYYYRN